MRTLMTIVLPHASAGATFHAHISSGKFHGTMAPITPSGSWRVYLDGKWRPRHECNLLTSKLLYRSMSSIGLRQERTQSKAHWSGW